MTIAQLSSDGTLDSNTGYDSQNRSGSEPSKFSCAVDWLDVTFRAVAGASEAYELIDYLEIATGQNLHFNAFSTAFNGIQWDGCGRSHEGTMAWFKHPSEDAYGEPVLGALKLAFPGSVLTPAITQRLLEWFDFVGDDLVLECSRIDIALDDHEKFIKLGKIEQARRGGNFFNCSYTERVASKLRGEDEAVTLYFGARSSDKRLRVYDKTLESKGKIKGNRWEAQFRRKPADAAFIFWRNEWKYSPATVSNALARIVLGIVDFRERDDDDDDRYRCERLDWFTALIKATSSDPMRIVAKPPVQTMQRSVNWVNKSVCSTLAMVKISLGSEFLPYIERVIAEGAGKLTNLRREIAYLASPDNLVF